jgi:hypothetical protein
MLKDVKECLPTASVGDEEGVQGGDKKGTNVERGGDYTYTVHGSRFSQRTTAIKAPRFPHHPSALVVRYR